MTIFEQAKPPHEEKNILRLFFEEYRERRAREKGDFERRVEAVQMTGVGTVPQNRVTDLIPMMARVQECQRDASEFVIVFDECHYVRFYSDGETAPEPVHSTLASAEPVTLQDGTIAYALWTEGWKTLVTVPEIAAFGEIFRREILKGTPHTARWDAGDGFGCPEPTERELQWLDVVLNGPTPAPSRKS